MTLFSRLSMHAAVSAALLVSTAPAFSQQVYTAHDYAQAERWMSYSVNPLVQGTPGGFDYLPDGRIFYSQRSGNSTAYFIADPAHGTQAPAFDNAKLATALSAGQKRKADPARLGITGYMPEASGFAVDTRGGKFHCDAAITRCMREPDPPPPVQIPLKANADKPPASSTAAARPAGRRRGAPENASPDKKLVAFIRDNNLWVRVVATGQEHPLTTDGVTDYGYATDNAGWEHSDMAILTWSADSKKIATFQLDQRKTGMMYLVQVTNHHPQLDAWHYPLLGDKDVTMIEPVIIDVDSGSMTRLKIPAMQHRSMECDDVSCDGDGRWSDVEFSSDDRHLAFVSTSRDHKDEWVKIADTSTGDVRDIYYEHVDTYYGWQSNTDWKYLPDSNELLWVSERSNWAQIYLYDLTTGKLKNQITHGDGPVASIANVDEKNRVIYFEALGKTPNVNPYYHMLYRVGFDGKDQTLLTPEPLNHTITMSPDGATFVDQYSTADTPQTAVLRDNNGKVVMPLAKQDISRLVAAGWKPPMIFSVKARDGKTDIYGDLWRPTNFDPSKKYPIVDYIYPGPQGGSCGSRSFSASHGDDQALADLGFVVICLDGMGNPERSKSFHDAHASKPQDMGDDTIPDQVAGIRQLAQQNPWIDAGRVGIWGHSGGGNASTSAMFHFPDFFKVGWSESGNHDNRDYEDDWDERWAGLEVIGPDGQSNYEPSANQVYAGNLKGHLMLVHGTSDDNVPPNNTLVVVDALIKAGKDFDLIMIPNAHHGYGDATQYIMKRRWDYFIRWLAGGTPAEYHVKSMEEIGRMVNGPSAGGPDGDAGF